MCARIYFNKDSFLFPPWGFLLENFIFCVNTSPPTNKLVFTMSIIYTFLILQDYIQRMGLQRRLYGIQTVCFLRFDSLLGLNLFLFEIIKKTIFKSEDLI